MPEWLDDAKEKMQETVYDALVNIVETYPVDLYAVQNFAEGKKQWQWRTISSSLAFGGGAWVTFIPSFVAPWIPGPGWAVAVAGNGAAIVVDVVALFAQMAKSAYGTGVILAEEEGLSLKVIDHEDFVDILCIWVNAPDLVANASAKSVLLANTPAALLAAKASAKAAAKATAKSLVVTKVIATLSPVIGTKLAAKIGSKIAAKFSGAIPFVGPFLNGGVNAWFVNEICAAAETFYKAKLGI